MKHLSVNYAKNSSLIFYGILSVIAFGLNWIWEIRQMFAYAMEANDSWTKSFLFCTLASFTDAIVTVATYVFLKFLMKPGGAKFYLCAAVLGALCAIGFEWFAFRFGLWSYGEQMIVLPVINVGLMPFVQLTLLLPLAIWLTRKFKDV
ncbi:MAG: hypothetical protein M3367_18160 [Acidobacteriota bacterium]|nr:hypothetical protein [Acidobacteriota bacterium]